MKLSLRHNPFKSKLMLYVMIDGSPPNKKGLIAVAGMRHRLEYNYLQLIRYTSDTPL
jgi:hypothetical protein